MRNLAVRQQRRCFVGVCACVPHLVTSLHPMVDGNHLLDRRAKQIPRRLR